MQFFSIVEKGKEVEMFVFQKCVMFYCTVNCVQIEKCNEAIMCVHIAFIIVIINSTHTARVNHLH